MNKRIREKSKEIARTGPSMKGGMVNHPFIESSHFNGESIFESREAFEGAVREIERKIDSCKKPRDIMNLVRPTYRVFWFAMCRLSMPSKDSSELMGILGITKPSWLKGADKKYLMSKQEYKTYKKIPSSLKLYSMGDGWTEDISRAKANKKGEVLMAEVTKGDVLAYYNRHGEDKYIVATSRVTPIMPENG